MEFGMMVFGIVDNHNNTPPTSRTGLSEAFEKHMECHGIKLSFLSLENQFPIPQTNSAEIAHTLTGGVMQQYGVLFLRRNPHQTPRSMLLKMDFIDRPQINVRISGKPTEFFYMPPEAQDWLGRSAGVVCADETQRT